MTANNLLGLLPKNLLEELATESRVNKYSKKLQGEVPPPVGVITNRLF